MTVMKSCSFDYAQDDIAIWLIGEISTPLDLYRDVERSRDMYEPISISVILSEVEG